MTRAPYPATWPGTAIIKSTHNAFNWRLAGHERCSEFASTPVNRAPLFNKWLYARAESPRATADWPQYRDTHTAPARRGPKRKEGIGHNGGTLHGLSHRADKLLQPRRANLPGQAAKATQVTPMHLARKPGRPTKVANHGGAYSKAVAK